MSRSIRLFFQLAVVVGVVALLAFAGIALAVNAISVKLKRDSDAKCLMMTAREFQLFVLDHGRWPKNEAELVEGLGMTESERASTLRDMEPLYVSYNCDLQTENLDSPETFRCLQPKDPKALAGIGEDGMEELLKTLRAARDGTLPSHAQRESPDEVPVGQASPDAAEP